MVGAWAGRSGGGLASLNERALQSVLQLAGEGEGDGWERVTDAEGVAVYRKYLDASGSSAAEEVVCGGGGARASGNGACVIGEDGGVVAPTTTALAAGAEEAAGGHAAAGGGSSRFACVKVR